MSKLVTYVHVQDNEGGYTAFGPDDELPEWAARRIGAHAFENGEHPYPEGDSEAERVPGSVPPKAGKGSSRDAWAAYANDVDVDIPADAQRDQIIEAIAAAGKPTESES